VSGPMPGSQGPAFSRLGLDGQNGCAGERRPRSSRPRGKDLLSDRIAGDVSTNAQRKVGRSPLTKPARTPRLRWAARCIWRDPRSAQPVRGWKHVRCSQVFLRWDYGLDDLFRAKRERPHLHQVLHLPFALPYTCPKAVAHNPFGLPSMH
jgi:hypothetical protein